MAKRNTLPTLRGDRAGYVLESRSIDGFEDRPDLGPRARLILARMAQRYTPETLSDAQRDLLEKPEQETSQPSERLVDLTRNLEDLDAAYEAGLFDDLSADEVALIRDPSNHPDLPDGTLSADDRPDRQADGRLAGPATALGRSTTHPVGARPRSLALLRRLTSYTRCSWPRPIGTRLRP